MADAVRLRRQAPGAVGVPDALRTDAIADRAAHGVHRAALTRVTRFVLPLAATPAVLVSGWLLRVGGAPRSVQVLQGVAATLATAVFLGLVRVRRGWPAPATPWLALGLAATAFVPLLGDSTGGPARWLIMGGVRLYVAPVVLPLLLFLLGTPWSNRATFAAAVIAVAAALVLQPDAAQLTAFASGTLVLLLWSASHPVLRVALAATLLGCAFVVWRLPDPLAPVRYVEGVFGIAAEVSSLALLLALLSAALPVIAWVWVARALRSAGTFAVAVYYACLFALAPLQVTPVPLLGFGAGPILGYALVAGVVSGARSSSRRMRSERPPGGAIDEAAPSNSLGVASGARRRVSEPPSLFRGRRW